MNLTEILTSIGPTKCTPYTIEGQDLVVNSTRIPLSTPTPFKSSGDGGHYYTLSALLLFMEHLDEPHTNYVKHLEQYHPEVSPVHQSDRTPIKLFFEEGATPAAATDNNVKVRALFLGTFAWFLA